VLVQDPDEKKVRKAGKFLAKPFGALYDSQES
jgi:hypothetical protein